MNEKQLKEIIYDRFIKPTEDREDSYIGLEIEMPVINLSGEITDQELSKQTFEKFVDEYGFERLSFDENGTCYSATHPDNEDNISFDCSFNNLELSLGRVEDLNEVYDRFKDYVTFLNDNFSKKNHTLSGFGINPNYRVNNTEFFPQERYRALGRYLAKSADWDAPFEFHHYPAYGTFASASQVQLDINKENLVDSMNYFSELEPYCAILFSNSVLDDQPDYNCGRDLLYNTSTIALSPNNIGSYPERFETIDDIVDYKMNASLFMVERDGKFIIFKPIPLKDYFNTKVIQGEVYDGEKFVETEFEPQDSDFQFFRTYNFEDLTFRGTIEFRANCNQPFCNSMSVAAFYLGLIRKFPELGELLEEDPLRETGYSVKELRKSFVKNDWKEHFNKEKVQTFLIELLNLAKEGLIERGNGEEIFLEPLFYRAENLINPAEFLNENFEGNEELIIKKFADFDEVNPLVLN